MVRFAPFAFAALALFAASPASARWTVPPASSLSYPGAPQPTYDDPVTPYPMNYTDEAAQSLGFAHGHMDVFQTHPHDSDGLLPSLSGGLGGDGAMIKLQWHPGQ